MAVCILLMIQRALRLPSIRISAILLCLAFIYDIFWVFISPYIFKQSVM
jgi:signal peptide peptidase-like protein 2B